ncbi:MAG: DEAD/DEAH box helicase [Candidatus Omnitrophica bacterium]|nr:DEAD/DEAH box helicase [Candidatus Omnitrophota bacterium]
MQNIYLSPGRRLYVEADDADQNKDLLNAFAKSSGAGLLFLDVVNDAFTEDAGFAFWKDFARLYLSLFAATPNLEQIDFTQDPPEVDVPDDDLNRFLATIPAMKGAEYCDKECLRALWLEIETALREEIRASGKNVADYFAARHSSWSLLGRVCFHLAENKASESTPFAFLATYAPSMTKDGRAQHLPLSKALEEYGSAKNKSVLLRLLAPIHKAAQDSAYLKAAVDSGEIYHPLALNPGETYQFLKDIPVFMKAGIYVKAPNWWKAKQPNRPQVQVRIGEKQPGKMGFQELIDFQMSVVVGDQELNEQEIRDLLQRSENLVFFKGQWVEVDAEKLKDLLSKWKTVAQSVKDGGLTFAEGMRWLSGVPGAAGDDDLVGDQFYTRVVSGQWLKTLLESLRSPEEDQKIEDTLRTKLKTELRPYQSKGVSWLNMLHQMHLGAVLADDMGLGKTIQVIAFLLLRQRSVELPRAPALLIVPASIIGNWKAELERFAPSLKFWIAHPSGQGTAKPSEDDLDVVITTYGSAIRLTWLPEQPWSVMILDEAQAIKNPAAKQTRAIKALKSQNRIALTGTPVENHLSDLWSLFDFVSPGLLGSARDFDGFIKRKTQTGEGPYAGLRTLLRPYILRRLKTDRTVIRDLPDKTEVKTYCLLSKGQAVLYQQSVESLAREIKEVDGIQRRGMILSYLMRFKQICNHPAQFVKDGNFSAKDSGKFMRLKEICETIADKQEKVLVFTQFREMTGPLADFLRSVFGKTGLILHGGTPVKKRPDMVAAFQKDDGPPYFVLSLKAGGTGLNLTAASHVIHFDRWWNPAVEDQATDRAFRIGQKRNVLVHKFICKGTLEEKIDALIESKQAMSKEILEGADSAVLTEMSNEELLKVVSLDIKSAVSEG